MAMRVLLMSSFAASVCLLPVDVASAGDDKNHVYLTGILSHVAVTAPGPAQQVSFFIQTDAPYDQELEAVCAADNFFALGCSDFVGREDLIGLHFEFHGYLALSVRDKQLTVFLSETPEPLAKPD